MIRGLGKLLGWWPSATQAEDPARRAQEAFTFQTHVPATTGLDRANLIARQTGISETLALFIDKWGFEPRIAAVREGRPGIRPSEREVIRGQLSALDRAKQKELRRLLVEAPPHPRLGELRGHDAVRGPPTVDGLLAILDGSLFGHAVATAPAPARSYLERIFPPGRALSLGDGAQSFTVVGLTADGSVSALDREKKRKLLSPGRLLHHQPELIPPELRAVPLAELLEPPPPRDLSGLIFTPGQPIRAPRSRGAPEDGWELAEHLPEQGVVLARRGAAITAHFPEELLLANPRLIPVGLEVSLPCPEGWAESGWQVTGVSPGGQVLLERDGGAFRVSDVGELLVHNRQALLGPAALSRPLTPGAPQADPPSKAEAAAVVAALAPRFERIVREMEAAYEASRSADAATRRRVTDWMFEPGRVLYAIAQLRGAMLHQDALALPALARQEVQRRLAYIDQELERALAKRPALPETAPAPEVAAPPPLFADAAEARAALSRAAAPTITALEAENREHRAICVEICPTFSVSSALLGRPNGRLATAEELTRFAREAAGDGRLANDFHDSGCYARAHLLAEWMQQQGLAAAKLFVRPRESMFMGAESLRPKVNGEQVSSWSYHVAAVAFVREPDGSAGLRIIDPGLADTPLTVSSWTERFLHRFNFFVGFELADPRSYEPGQEPSDERHAFFLANACQKLVEFSQANRGGRS